MERVAKAWQKRFETVWDLNGPGRYREGSPGQRMIKIFVQYLLRRQTVNDYGSGTGRAAMELLKYRPGTRINMIDIATNALEQPALTELAKTGTTLTFTHSALEDLPEDFPHADWGYCIEVLCFVNPDKLDAILKNIHRTCDRLFCQVYSWQDRRCGYELTTIIMDKEGWRKKLLELWRYVEPIPHPETANRYLYICGK